MSDTTIVLLSGEDAGEIAALEAVCFSLPWTEGQYQKLLSANHEQLKRVGELPPMCIFGMRDADGKLLAYVCLGIYHQTQELEIYNIAVREDMRRAGLGGRLLSHALGRAFADGIEVAFLEVRTTNVAAIALYEKFGFAVCGRRKAYYTDTGEDALVMRSSLMHK